MNLRPLFPTLLVVLGLSVYTGYWTSASPFLSSILREIGHSPQEVVAFYFHMSIFNMVGGLVGPILNLFASYYAGKQYVLTKNSALTFLFLLIITIWLGSFTGYLIRQIELPQYPILNVTFFVYTLSQTRGPVVWSFLGVLAGNYIRERRGKGARANF